MSNTDVTSRVCTKCSETKPLADFSAQKGGLYGKKAHCKACDAARHRALHPEQPRKQVPRRRAAIDPADPKICTSCSETKPHSEFSLSRAGTETRNAVYRSACKACQATQARGWFHDNKERAKENRHRWALANTYGITPEEYLERLEAQGGVCAICDQGEPAAHGRTGTQFRLSVDHCHETGRVRGLLCQKCNRAIGLLGDNPDLLRRAITYLAGATP